MQHNPILNYLGTPSRASLPAECHSQLGVTPNRASLPAGCHSQPGVTPSRASLPTGHHSQQGVTPRHTVLHTLFAVHTHFSTLNSKLSRSELSSPRKQSLPIAPRYSMTHGAVSTIWCFCRALLRRAATGRGYPSTCMEAWPRKRDSNYVLDRHKLRQ